MSDRNTASKLLRSNAKAVAKATAINDKPTEYRISGARGLVLLVQASGTRSWYFYYHVQVGKRRRLRKLKLGSFDELTLGQAIDIAEKWRAEVKAGADPVEDSKRRRDAITFAELAEERFAKGDSITASTERLYRDYLTRDVVPLIGDLPAEAVTARQIIEIQDQIDARGAKTTADRTRAAISSVFKYGLQRHIVPQNPCAGLAKRADEIPRQRVLTREEMHRFWHAIDEASMSPAMRLIIRLAVLTGQRRGEVAGARKDELHDLDGEEPRWIIPGHRRFRGRVIAGRTKNRQKQIVPLSGAAVELFRHALALAGDSKFVFPSPIGHSIMGHVRPDAVSKSIRRLREQCGIEDVTIHDMRRVVATTLADEFDVSDRVIERILNHIDGSVTARHYNQATLLRQVREALEHWSAWIMEVVGEKLEPVTPDRVAYVP